MRLFKFLLIALVFVISLLMLLAMLLPSSSTVARSVTISGLPEKVLADIRNFHHWKFWNQYAIDTASVSNNVSADGTSLVLTDKENRQISYKLDGGNSDTLIILESVSGTINSKNRFISRRLENGQTFLIWTVSTELGKMPWQRLKGVVMDKFMGPQYEQSLNRLKRYLESNGTPG